MANVYGANFHSLFYWNTSIVELNCKKLIHVKLIWHQEDLADVWTGTLDGTPSRIIGLMANVSGVMALNLAHNFNSCPQRYDYYFPQPMNTNSSKGPWHAIDLSVPTIRETSTHVPHPHN